MIQLDILAVVAHPDDAEISAGGTLLRQRSLGHTVGIVDLTRGELGTRGSAEIRDLEAGRAAERLGLAVRENLGLADGFFRNDQESMVKVAEVIRKYRPHIVLTNAIHDRHPDHGRAASLVRDACFYAGLPKLVTDFSAWRPTQIYHMIQDYYIEPGLIVDVASFWEEKIEVLKCYSTQFFNPDSVEPVTPISGPEFFDFLRSRAITLARPGGLLLAEGFVPARVPVTADLLALK
ncbi:MAG: bacillithiol biosynthesis deacetylase BshB1 [Flavobacteriales bacterium]|jgi:bacillithiol biosynthesis deacetylase BshB1